MWPCPYFLAVLVCIGLPACGGGAKVTSDAAAASDAALLSSTYPPQYASGDVTVPGASADEPVLAALSVARAVDYLEKGAWAWRGQGGCVSCHTNGSYMVARPALTPQLGVPSAAVRAFFVEELARKRQAALADLMPGTGPGEVIYLAAGLAEWDAHVNKSLSAETERALELMFDLQLPSGTWGSRDCWPPYESDAFHEATVAAMAAITAPGWLERVARTARAAAFERLKDYLRSTPPPHDYGRLLLLWAATRVPDLLSDAQRAALVDMVWTHQRLDGGWSIRTFAAPEAWGSGNRAGKLRAEPELANPPSDGHQTGLAIVVLRAAAVASDEPRLVRGLDWLRSHQRASGRWWTRSLNTDNAHFITYSGTLFPLLALASCDALPSP